LSHLLHTIVCVRMQDDSEWDADDQLVTNNDSENSESSMDEPELPLAATDVQHLV